MSIIEKIKHRKQTNQLKTGKKMWTDLKEDMQIANNDMKRYSISHIFKELQTEIAMRYHWTFIRKAKIQNTDNTKH